MDEKTLKKTVELIMKDIRKVFDPIIRGYYSFFVMMFYAFISSAALMLLNFQGDKIYTRLKGKIRNEWWRDELFSVPTFIFGIVIGSFFIYELITVGKPFFLFLVITHTMGLLALVYDYTMKKKEEALGMLHKNPKETKKIRGVMNK